MSIDNLPWGFQNIAKEQYSEVQSLTKVGQIIRPIERPADDLRGTAWLTSGGSQYSCAVVIQLEPLVLVSPGGDMRWGCEKKVEDYEAMGEATDEVLTICMARL